MQHGWQVETWQGSDHQEAVEFKHVGIIVFFGSCLYHWLVVLSVHCSVLHLACSML